MGKLVAPRDERALAAGLLELLLDPGRYRKSRDDIRRVFNTDRSIDAYEKLLGSLVSRN